MERIITRNIQKSIKNKIILNSSSLCVKEGEICALVGPNGVGKTTLLKCLLGLIRPDQGTIEINNKRLTDTNRSEILPHIGAVLQYSSSISGMTISQLFIEHFHYLNLNNGEPWEGILQRVDLNVSTETRIGNLSLGMKQKLLLAVALSHNPNIVILDEPFNGLDMDGMMLIKSILKRLQSDNISVLIASHSLPELEDLATSAVFMLNGITYEKKDTKEILEKYEGGFRQYYQHFKKGD